MVEDVLDVGGLHCGGRGVEMRRADDRAVGRMGGQKVSQVRTDREGAELKRDGDKKSGLEAVVS